MFVGIGYDVHRFKKGRALVLGGVTIPHVAGLDGHSDADVLIHAVMDALLGSAGLPDIGHYFPTTDQRYRNCSSCRLLTQVCAELKKKKVKINNIDVTLIAEAPKIYPHIPAMKARLAAAMKLPASHIGIKATTNEGMGFIGRGEGIAAMAVASVRR